MRVLVLLVKKNAVILICGKTTITNIKIIIMLTADSESRVPCLNAVPFERMVHRVNYLMQSMLRVDEESETRGLDLSEHGEEGYIWL